MEPFTVAVPESDLVDLNERLARTRFNHASRGESWAAGTPTDYLAGLLAYWETEFDWRAQEAWLNSFDQFTAEISGRRLHFVHIKSSEPGATPLVITHGWPYSFADMLSLVPLLPSFDLVIPSLPGFGFSEAPDGYFTDESVADTLHELMTGVLGYDRYGTYGEDIGSSVSHRLAAKYSNSVIGIFVTHPALPNGDNREHLSTEETAFLDWLSNVWEDEVGYNAIQSTRPDTLAAALNDSPAGLAAWIVEKFRAWSDRGAEAGEQLSIDEKFPRDDLLTTVALYWFTQSIGSSFLSYYDYRHRAGRPIIGVPTGIAIGTGDLGYPRELAERCYTDIRVFIVLPSGGHFTAKEEPEAVAAGIRAFFGALQ